MVAAGLRDLVERFRQAVDDDFAALRLSTLGHPIVQPGLIHYDIDGEDLHRRVHLRINEDLSGELLLDVSEVIFLNQTAMEIAVLALENVPKNAASRYLHRRYSGMSETDIDVDLDRIYRMVDTFSSNGDLCPTCTLGNTQYVPLFSGPLSAPYKADLALTYGCNNRCAHCYNEADRFPMPSLSYESWIKIIDRVHLVGIPHIIFTGGEATLHPNLPQLINYAESKGMVTGLNTNGRRLSFLPYTRTLKAAGLNHVQVTLASHHQWLHDEMMGARSFQQTLRGINNAQEVGIHTITNTTLTRRNCGEVRELIHFLHDIGIRTFAMNGMIFSGGGSDYNKAIPSEDLEPILIQVRDEARRLDMRFLWYTPTEYCQLSPVEIEIGAKRCNAGEYSICIEPNGDVLPCQSYYKAAGNMLNDEWQVIWDSALFRSFRERVDDPHQGGLPEKCWDCIDLPLCGGGCRIEREAACNSPCVIRSGVDGGSRSAIFEAHTRAGNGAYSYIPPPGITASGLRSRGITELRNSDV